MLLRRGVALAAAAVLPLSALAASPLAASAPASVAEARNQPSRDPASAFHRVATYPVFQNAPAGVDPQAETLAEISAVTPDGRTLVHTDAAGRRIGFVDISDPAAPLGAGTLDLSELGDAEDEPTSVAVVGDFVLVVVNTSSSYAAPSGRLDVIRVSDRTRVRSIDLGGQPDSIAISPDLSYAAIAMENERDEEATPEGGDEGDLPQLPAGFVQLVDLAGAPAAWGTRRVDLVQPDGAPLASFVDAGLDTPQDPEPEYVDINAGNQLVLSLQENNGLVVIDVPTGAVEKVFSAGSATVSGIDTTKNGLFDPVGTITAPREPDSVEWVGDGLVATANEGDWKGGTRGWTVFDATTGAVVWDAGNTFEQLATRLGLHNDGRAAKKGAEPEGLAFAEIGGRPRAFVGSERSNFVAVYDMSDPREPVLEQALATTNGPEGLLPIPSRDLFVVSSEEDDASAGVRATVGVYRYDEGRPAFPSIVSADTPAVDSAGTPIGWGALGALSTRPGDPSHLYAASDAAYATARIHTLDVSTAPATIDGVIEVTDATGARPALDIEGLHARRAGGFWLAVEGASGPGNALVRTDAAGLVVQTVALPQDVTSRLGKQGLEGVTALGSGAREQVYVALQRPLAGEDFARIGRYDVTTGAWTWFGYPLETTDVAGDWIGLSEITAVDQDTLAVIERDKLNGPAVRVKRVYTVDVPAGASGSSGQVRMLDKRLAVDVVPALRDLAGWTQEKLEGLGVTQDGRVFVVTDNDGLDDATGETQLIELGRLSRVFRDSIGTSVAVKAASRQIRRGRPVRLTVDVRPGFATGRVVVTERGRTLARARLHDGRAVLRVRGLRAGKHRLRVAYAGSATALPSTSRVVVVKVTGKRR
ncbi:esterase-like activity of phytase family protein [Nocardioides pacificus]